MNILLSVIHISEFNRMQNCETETSHVKETKIDILVSSVLHTKIKHVKENDIKLEINLFT
ncbi:unnamed protein product [Spirodela intermedia]|uniref:Uncharacterized protein n=1 Tax=Spirodela intermedia TaxID=51605 RepID=A0A7I8JM43_SPIIN|nr:unnamed protein product [Spirodela intermedia]CAA6670643.1 unnamed protein product [Spirodela intermedia]